MKTLQLIFLISLLSFTMNAQSKVDYSSFQGGATVTFKTVNYIQNSSFCEYNIKRKPKPVQTNELSINTTTPENLLAALSQCTNENAVSKLLMEGSESTFAHKYKTLPKVDSTHYFLITEKLSFDLEGHRVAILKYFRIENDVSSKAHSIQLQKLGDKWYIINNPALSGLEFIIGHLKYKVLYKFLEKGDNSEEAINSIAKKCLSDEGTLQYQKLYEALKNELGATTAFAEKWME